MGLGFQIKVIKKAHKMDNITLTKPPSFVIKPSFDATFKNTYHKLWSLYAGNI